MRSFVAIAVLALGFGAACSGNEEAPADRGKAVIEPVTGLRVELLETGEPGTAPKTGDRVKVHYTGRLTTGAQFDSSAGRDPFEFIVGLGGVIPGWDKAVREMNVGSKAKVTIPPRLAYGPGGQPPAIPPNATLVFDMELVEVVRPKKTESGLGVQTLSAGQGEPPRPGQCVMMDFMVITEDGRSILDSSVWGPLYGIAGEMKLDRQPVPFLDEATPLLKRGASHLFIVPPGLALGAGSGLGVPKDAVTVWGINVKAIAAPPEFRRPDLRIAKKTSSGLIVETLREGDGLAPTAQSTVTVHYTGWLTDGTLFDSSHVRGEPTTFALNRVIRGWTEGLQLMKEGGTAILEVTPELGYGTDNRARGPIGPNATLIFLVELIKVQ